MANVDFSQLNNISANGQITPKAPSAPAGPAMQTSSAPTSYPVVTSKAATQNYNSIEQDYNSRIAPNVNASAQASNQAQVQANSLPVIDGYNVSANQTGNAGETKATNQASGQSYYITPQKPAATADDVKNILSSPDTSAPAASPVSNSQTPVQQAESQTGTNAITENQKYQSDIKGVNDDITNGYNSFVNTIKQIQTGGFPLTGPQQALVDATNQAFQQMNTQANLKAAALSSETGGVSAKVNATAGELTNITAQQAAAVANLEIGFQNQNYKMVTDSYSAFKDLESNRLSVIKDLHDSVMETYNKSLADAQKVTDNINSVAMDAAKNGADTKTIAAIKSAPDEFGAIQAAGGYLQSATGTLGDYLQYKRDAEAKGLVPTDYTTYKDNEEKKSNQRDIDKSVAIENAKARATANGVSPATLTKVQTVANQFDAEPAVKNYETIAETLDAVQNAGKTPADDIQRIYAFAKVMDPNSAVREGEYKTVQDYATSLLQRTGIKANRVFNNSGFLTDEARGFLKDTLENRLASSEKAYNNIYSEYGRRIDKLTGTGDGTDYITDYSKGFKQDPEKLAKSSVDNYIKDNPSDAEEVAKLYEIPGATDKDISDYLKAQGKI